MPTKYHGVPNEVLALNTFIKFTRASNAMENRLYQSGVIEDLTQSQFGVLETLHHLGPMCPGELSTKLLKSTGNMTLVIDNLEKNGLVRRVRDADDRRKITIYLTPDGQQLIERIFPKMLKAIVDEFSVLSSVEQDTFGELCRAIGMRSRR